jgi:hypothetical protein
MASVYGDITLRGRAELIYAEIKRTLGDVNVMKRFPPEVVAETIIAQIESHLRGVEGAVMEEALRGDGPYEYAVLCAIVEGTIDASRLQERINNLASESYEPIDFQETRVILRRRKPSKEVGDVEAN